MKILSIETATSRQSVALLDGDQVLARSDQEARGAHARWLIPTIDRLLRDTGLSLRQLQGLAVSIGPGSFTGLRVGLATVLGFRLVTGLPVAAVPTLEGLAWNVRGSKRPICPILKARTGQVYWALYQIDTGEPGPQMHRQIHRLMAERVGPPTSIPPALPQPVTVLGDGWLAYRDEIGTAVQVDALFEESSPEAMWPSAVSVGLAAQARLARGEVAGPELVPLYVQRPDAELVWEAKQTVGRSR
jgi:tRNA threonylcarbamoyladenosine biosynthesis protein TsaB